MVISGRSYFVKAGCPEKGWDDIKAMSVQANTENKRAKMGNTSKQMTTTELLQLIPDVTPTTSNWIWPTGDYGVFKFDLKVFSEDLREIKWDTIFQVLKGSEHASVLERISEELVEC